MSLVKFISNNNSNVWKEYKINGLRVWLAGIETERKD